MSKFRKGQHVTYPLPALSGSVKAIVRRVHRDGTVTVEARFFVRDGKQVSGYLGYKYRFGADLLRPANPLTA